MVAQVSKLGSGGSGGKSKLESGGSSGWVVVAQVLKLSGIEVA